MANKELVCCSNVFWVWTQCSCTATARSQIDCIDNWCVRLACALVHYSSEKDWQWVIESLYYVIVVKSRNIVICSIITLMLWIIIYYYLYHLVFDP